MTTPKNGDKKMLRKLILAATVCLVMPAVLAVTPLEEANSCLKKGDAAYRENRHKAVTFYWEAAALGATSDAIDKLGKFYNKWRLESWYDWDIPRKYLAKAADANYKHDPQRYDGTFFIIAKERSIVEKYGVSELKKTWSGDYCCKRAIDNLAKRFYTTGKNGEKVRMRTIDITIKGNDKRKTKESVAVLDFASALENFDFVDRPDTDWLVYVRSPHKPNTLLLFSDFHRFVYEEKMAAFIELCSRLGAKEASVYYQSSDSKSGAAEVQVRGNGVISYASAQLEAKAAIKHSNDKSVGILITFAGAGIVQEYDSPWLDKEPTWRAMYKARRNRKNPATECDAVFHYTDDFRVNAATKTAFENIGCKIAVGTHAEFRHYTSIIWKFKVVFPRATIRVPRLKLF